MDEAKLAGGIFVVVTIGLFAAGVCLCNWIESMKRRRAAGEMRPRYPSGTATRIAG